MNATTDPQVNTELIVNRAYEIWAAEGRPSGRAIDHWRQAEREVLAKEASPPRTAASPAAKPAHPSESKSQRPVKV